MPFANALYSRMLAIPWLSLAGGGGQPARPLRLPHFFLLFAATAGFAFALSAGLAADFAAGLAAGFLAVAMYISPLGQLK